MLSYPLAPLFGIAAAPAGGANVLVIVAIVALLASFGIGGLRKYMQQAKATQASALQNAYGAAIDEELPVRAPDPELNIEPPRSKVRQKP